MVDDRTISERGKVNSIAICLNVIEHMVFMALPVDGSIELQLWVIGSLSSMAMRDKICAHVPLTVAHITPYITQNFI